MKEKLKKQEHENIDFNALMNAKFNKDAGEAPAFTYEQMIYEKRRKARSKRTSFILKISTVSAALLVVFAVIFNVYTQPRKIQYHFDISKYSNSNKMERVTMLYESGKAEIQKDSPIPMVWVRKGD